MESPPAGNLKECKFRALPYWFHFSDPRPNPLLLNSGCSEKWTLTCPLITATCLWNCPLSKPGSFCGTQETIHPYYTWLLQPQNWVDLHMITTNSSQKCCYILNLFPSIPWIIHIGPLRGLWWNLGRRVWAGPALLSPGRKVLWLGKAMPSRTGLGIGQQEHLFMRIYTTFKGGRKLTIKQWNSESILVFFSEKKTVKLKTMSV